MNHEKFYDGFETTFKDAEVIQRSVLYRWIMRERKITNKNLIVDWVKKLELLGYIRYKGADWYMNLKFKGD
jgi:hypothetical protein